MNKGKPTASMMALQGAIFHLKAQLVLKLQSIEFQTKDLVHSANVLLMTWCQKSGS